MCVILYNTIRERGVDVKSLGPEIRGGFAIIQLCDLSEDIEAELHFPPL